CFKSGLGGLRLSGRSFGPPTALGPAKVGPYARGTRHRLDVFCEPFAEGPTSDAIGPTFDARCPRLAARYPMSDARCRGLLPDVRRPTIGCPTPDGRCSTFGIRARCPMSGAFLIDARYPTSDGRWPMSDA